MGGGGGWGPQALPLDPPLRTTGAKHLPNACVVRELINRSGFFFSVNVMSILVRGGKTELTRGLKPKQTSDSKYFYPFDAPRLNEI